jgi:hypothetical protein
MVKPPAAPRRSRSGGRGRRSGWVIGLAVTVAVIRLIGLATHHTTTVNLPAPFIYTTPSFPDIPTVPSTNDFPPIPTTPG